jgi:hypothetical protein
MRHYVVLSTTEDGTQLVWGKPDGQPFTNRRQAEALASALTANGLDSRTLPLLRSDE